MTDESPDQIITTKLIGVVLAFLLAVGGVLTIGWGDASVEPRMASFAEAFPGMITWWREDVGVLMIFGMALMMAPIAVIPGAFGVRWRQLMPKLSKRWRTVLVLGLAAAICANGIAYRLLGGRDIGVATIDRAEWLRNGAPFKEWRWAQATKVEGGCTTSRRRSGSDPSYHVDYRVRFPDGREARLAFRADDMAIWANSIQAIDEQLRAAGVRRFMTSDAECLTHYREILFEQDMATFKHVLGSAS